MAHVAYWCAAMAVLLVAVQFWLYGIHYNRVFADNVVSAVTLTNGQTYFGRLEKFGPHTAVLFNAYYLQVGETDVTAAEQADGSNLQLKKLSDDFHQPNDYLILNREEILYWQHLSSQSPIIEAMAEYRNQE
ncbi:MAG: hypothetical protein ACD_41C00306G0006 [uncultured bacterium]|nr:MAG: hypothetical protein ACD_41C00306G0006 [uncultured bacterium]